MKKLFLIFLVTCLAGAAFAQAPILRTGWTTNSDVNAARAALGLSGTNFGIVTATNTYTNITVSALTIGTGSNAITFQPTNGSATGDVGMNLPWLNATTVTGATVVASSITLGGSNLSTWPAGGGVVVGGGFAGGISLAVSFSTNLAPITGLTNLGYFTNGYYSASWVSTNGDALELQTSADASSWSSASPSTNGQYLRMAVALASLSGGTAAASNLVIYSISDVSVSGGTNDFRTTALLADDPTTNNQVATKGYVDAAAVPRSWAQYRAVAPVNLARNPLALTPEWNWRQTVVSNEVRLQLDFAGSPVMTFSPGFTGISNGVSITAGSFVTVNVWTNNSGPFRLLCSTNSMDNWLEVAATNSYPSAVGTNYTLTFPKLPDMVPVLIAVGRSNAPTLWLPTNTIFR